ARPTADAPPPDAAVPTFTLTVEVTGTGKGKIQSTPEGINCPGTCSFAFEQGTNVALSASVVTGNRFSGWMGEGCSGTTTCRVMMDQARTVKAELTDLSNGYNFLFIGHADSGGPNFSPLTKADAICAASAQQKGLTGTYVAWVSSS